MNRYCKKLIKNTQRFVRKILTTFSPAISSRLLFFHVFHRSINLRNPKTLNEKITWLKIYRYENDALVTQCADKYKVRDYVCSRGLSAILNNSIGVYERVNEIPWETLPERFALKCNHGCGYNLIVRNKKELDINEAEKRLARWLHEDYWRLYAELNYKGIPKRIICEAYLEGIGGTMPNDYKLYCFHGQPYCIMVCTEREDREPKFYFFDRDWRLLRINPDSVAAPEDFTLPRPSTLEDMFSVAQVLSAPFPFVRVDLYEIDERVVFGELTFTPASGLDKKRLPETDLLFGSMLHLPI